MKNTVFYLKKFSIDDTTFWIGSLVKDISFVKTGYKHFIVYFHKGVVCMKVSKDLYDIKNCYNLDHGEYLINNRVPGSCMIFDTEDLVSLLYSIQIEPRFLNIENIEKKEVKIHENHLHYGRLSRFWKKYLGKKTCRTK